MMSVSDTIVPKNYVPCICYVRATSSMENIHTHVHFFDQDPLRARYSKADEITNGVVLEFGPSKNSWIIGNTIVISI